MELTKKQAEALPYIQWLVEDDWGEFGTGRTTVLAYAFLNIAKKNPGKFIRIWDHFHGQPVNNSSLMRTIEFIQKENFADYNLVFNSTHITIKLTKKTNQDRH